MKFTKREISLIQNRTWINAHGENMEYIAKRINSPLEKDFKKINNLQKNKGFLTHDLFMKRHRIFMKLKSELKKKLSKQNFKEVWGSM